MKNTLISIVIFLSIAFFIWFTGSLIDYREATEQERYIYKGTVTAIIHGENVDKVWLNSNPEVAKINGTIELIIGETYEITINGFHELINAKIIER